MRLLKIKALMYRDFLAIRRVKYRSVELIYFPITTIIIWGLFAVYSREMVAEAGLILLIINIFWAFAHLAQTTSNILIMEDIWSGSLKQIFLCGISEFEYLIARMLTATIASTIMTLLLITLALPFGINFFKPIMALLIAITLIGSLALAVLVASMVFYLGREYGFLVWSAIQLFIMLSAPFFPKEIFPKAILYISYVMPFTAVFEAARAFSIGAPVENYLLWWGLAVNMGYFIFSWPIYHYCFRRAKITGMLSRMY